MFALEEFPKTLELFFESYPLPQRLYFERRSRQYESLAIEKTRIITFDAMIKAFAAMFLNEPHRTTRDFNVVRGKLGKEIFAKQQRMEPYYAAALGLYKIEFLFRNRRLHPKYKPGRFHILMATRILTAGYEMPDLGANKMEGYCRDITAVLHHATTFEECIDIAAELVEKAVGNRVFDRDTIRTEPFTERVIEAAKLVPCKTWL